MSRGLVTASMRVAAKVKALVARVPLHGVRLAKGCQPTAVTMMPPPPPPPTTAAAAAVAATTTTTDDDDDDDDDDAAAAAADDDDDATLRLTTASFLPAFVVPVTVC